MELVPMRARSRIEMMTAPAAAQKRITRKQNFDDFVCSWLVGIEANWSGLPQIHEAVSAISYSCDQLKVWTSVPLLSFGDLLVQLSLEALTHTTPAVLIGLGGHLIEVQTRESACWAGIENCFRFSKGDLQVNCLLLDRLFDSRRLLVLQGGQNRSRAPSFVPQSGHFLALLTTSSCRSR